MFRGTYDRVADTIVEIALTVSPGDGVRVLAIGGYPLTGKTRLAAQVALRWPSDSFVLATEAVIDDRHRRLAHDRDGSSIEAHNIRGLIYLLRQLRHGEAVSVPKYSWQTGTHGGTEMSPGLTEGGLVIVDGSISTASPIREHVDVALALRPTPLAKWLELAVARDVTERSWTMELAREQNVAKAQTVEAQLATFSGSPLRQLLTVNLDTSDNWTAVGDDGGGYMEDSAR